MPFPNDKTQFKPGVSGNPNGRPKGSLNWSHIVQDLLADENLADKALNEKPGWWEQLPIKNGASAVAMAMFLKAAAGDEKAAKWLRETGWGNKLDVTSGGEKLQGAVITFTDEPKSDDTDT